MKRNVYICMLAVLGFASHAFAGENSSSTNVVAEAITNGSGSTVRQGGDIYPILPGSGVQRIVISADNIGYFEEITSSNSLAIDFNKYDFFELQSEGIHYSSPDFDGIWNFYAVGDSIFLVQGDDLLSWDILSGESITMIFTAIPEPGTYALIFGALALGIAAYRGRK